MTAPLPPYNGNLPPSGTGVSSGQGDKFAASHRLSQAVIAGILIRDILGIWSRLQIASISATWPAIREALISLVRGGMARSLFEGTRYYSDMRAIAGITGELPSIIARETELAVITRTLDSTGPGTLLHDIKAGQPLLQAMDRAGVKVAGASARLVLQSGRENVIDLVRADPKAIAWKRVTSGRPCAFCAMLASRGAVYKSETSAGFLAHNNCACQPIPVFRKEDLSDPVTRALYDAWKQATKGLSGADAFRAWRREWESLDEGLSSLNVRAA